MFQLALSITLAVGAGVSLVVQQALNTNLRFALGSAVWSGFTSYLVGIICMALFALARREPMPASGLSAIDLLAWSRRSEPWRRVAA